MALLLMYAKKSSHLRTPFLRLIGSEEDRWSKAADSVFSMSCLMLWTGSRMRDMIECTTPQKAWRIDGSLFARTHSDHNTDDLTSAPEEFGDDYLQNGCDGQRRVPAPHKLHNYYMSELVPSAFPICASAVCQPQRPRDSHVWSESSMGRMLTERSSEVNCCHSKSLGRLVLVAK